MTSRSLWPLGAEQPCLGLCELLVCKRTALVQTGETFKRTAGLTTVGTTLPISTGVLGRQADLVPQSANLAP